MAFTMGSSLRCRRLRGGDRHCGSKRSAGTRRRRLPGGYENGNSLPAEKRTPRYIVCNADESEPLIFKDRVLIDTNPAPVAGRACSSPGYACGASEAWIYIRGEYESQARRLENAIAQAEEKNLLGENILGSGFSFHIHVHRGAGAYICGEETALARVA